LVWGNEGFTLTTALVPVREKEKKKKKGVKRAPLRNLLCATTSCGSTAKG